MTDLELTRTPGDRRLYTLEGVGTLRMEGFSKASATAQAGDRTLRLAYRGLWRRVLEATDETGAVVGEFTWRGRLRRVGALRWAGRELTLRPAGRWGQRYQLVDAERVLLVVEGKSSGRRPAKVTIADPAVDPSLVLCTVFVVQQAAVAASAAVVTSAVV